MLNLSEGQATKFQERDCIRPDAQGHTHVVFGPYERLDAGRHVAEFLIAREDGADMDDRTLVAILDVAADHGRTILAHEFVFAGQLTDTLSPFKLAFELRDAADGVEYRVRARGHSSIVVADGASSRPHDGADGATVSQAPQCSLVRDTPHEIVDLFKRGYRIGLGEGCLHFGRGDIVIAADERDDLNFASEVLELRAYNLAMDAEQCVIDVGMNVGLTSLFFASKEKVREVHAFEPFPTTYAKAQRNLALNPVLAQKVHATNAGLSNRDADETILVPETTDSGSRATISAEGGKPTQLKLQDAASTLRPIIAAARRAGRRVVMKVDCEGSEFSIFASLAKGGLLAHVDAYLVEWHAMFADKTAATLTRPLLREGFTVIDLSPDHGNGFFYAVRGGDGKAGGVRRLAKSFLRRV